MMSSLARRLPQRGKDGPEPATAVVVDFPDHSPLQWECRPANGGTPFDADLTSLTVACEGVGGRPGLIGQLARTIRAETQRSGRKRYDRIVVALRHLLRFLDVVDDLTGRRTDDLSAIGHAFGESFKQHLLAGERAQSSNRAYYNVVRSLLSDARRRAGHAHWALLWPTIRDDRGTLHRDVDPAVIVPLYKVVKRHRAEWCVSMDRTAAMADAASDPRPADDKAAWSAGGYAWAMKAYVAAAAADPSLTKEAFAGRNLTHPERLGIKRVTDYHGHFAPSHRDAAAAWLLVAIHTGWNGETVNNIDATDEGAWCDERLGEASDKASVAIHALKGRTGREQVAVSLKRPSAHPYQVISSQIRRSEVLREGVRVQLAAVEAQPPTAATERLCHELRRMIRSPWLFFAEQPQDVGGHVGVVQAGNGLTGELQRFGREAIARAARRGVDGPDLTALATLRPSDLRDGFASFVYEDSLYNELRVKRALGHAHLSSTRHYLRQRRHLAQRFKEFTRFTTALFDEVGSVGTVDPTILHLRVRLGDVSDAQRRRLADHRKRTRMGMGCLDPLDPPSDLVAPENVGRPCAVQRCTLCRHGVVFAESFDPLAVRMAELRHARSEMSSIRFDGSSFQAEWLAIEALVEGVFASRAADFADAVEGHLGKIRRGEAYLFIEATNRTLHPKGTT